MSSLIKNIIRFCLFILVQVFVLDQIPPLHQLVTPYIYFLFILWLPFKMGRRMQMLLAFALGFALDCFSNSYGMHAAACVLIAYLRNNFNFYSSHLSLFFASFANWRIFLFLFKIFNFYGNKFTINIVNRIIISKEAKI